MTTRRHIHGGETLAQKELTRTGENRTTGQQGKTSNRDSIPSDPVQGLVHLAKPLRDRQQMRGWQKGARK